MRAVVAVLLCVTAAHAALWGVLRDKQQAPEFRGVLPSLSYTPFEPGHAVGDSIADFYRELGDLFGVPLRPHNRWAGFRALRERWVAHIESTLMRPIVLIDEAQEMNHVVLNELRILTSARFDSVHFLSVVLAGDARLPQKLRHEDLLPLGSRIRTRLALEHATADELRACLMHLMKAAGNPKLMTRELVEALCDHALGNYRMLTTMASELLAVAAQRELEMLDEKLYLEIFAASPSAADKPRRARAAARP